MGGVRVIKTTSDIITEQYEKVCSGSSASSKNLTDIDKLKAIHEQVNIPATGIYILEDSDVTADETRLSSEQYAAFLSQVIDSTKDTEILKNILQFIEKKLDSSWNTELLIKLAQCINENYLVALINSETFKRIMRIVYDKEAVFLELIKNNYFKKEKNINVFLQLMRENNWIQYSRLTEILFVEKSKPATNSHYLLFLNVLTQKIGSPSYSQKQSTTTGQVSTQQIGLPETQKPVLADARISEPSDQTNSQERQKSVVPGNVSIALTAEQTSPPSSPSNLTNQHVPSSFLSPVFPSTLVNLQDTIKTIIQQYLDIREVKTTCSWNFFRNIPHDKTLTAEKIKTAIKLTQKIEKAQSTCEIIYLLVQSKQWNQEEQKKEHTIWHRNEGEYGSHLERCLKLITETPSLRDIKKFVNERIANQPSNAVDLKTKLESAKDVYIILTILQPEKSEAEPLSPKEALCEIMKILPKPKKTVTFAEPPQPSSPL